MALSKIETSSLDVGQIGGRRNMLINGDMRVAQRGTSYTGQTGGTPYLVVDRWATYPGANPTVIDIAQESFAYNSNPTGENFQNYLKITYTTGLGSVGYTRTLRQKIEDLRKVAGKTVTLSFWISGNETVSGQNFYIDTFGNHGSGFSQYTWDVSDENGNNYNGDNPVGIVTTTWTKHEVTWTVPELQSELGEGNHFTVMFNLPIQNTGAEFYITGVQLELGGTATPFEHRSYGEELALCQRYFYAYESHSFRTGMLRPDGYRFGQLFYPVTMRANPTVAYTYNPDGSSTSSTTNIGTASTYFQSSSPITQSNSNPTVTGISFDAEL